MTYLPTSKIADGDDVAEGAIADAAVVADANGSVSGKLRGLVKLAAAWARNAGAVSADTLRVIIATDQTTFPVTADVAKIAGTATDVNSGNKGNGTLRVVIATDQPQLTTATKVDGSAVTQPVSIAAAVTMAAAENHVGEVGNPLAVPSYNFTRPADTTAYTSGDLVANSTVAGSVVPLSWTAARVTAGSFLLRRARLKKSTTTTTNASFRLHFYAADPSASSGITNGDNGAWLTKQSSYLGSMDVTIDKAFSDAAGGQCIPAVGSEMSVKLASGQTLYGLIEARAAYAPGNAEVFTVEIELFQN